MAFFRLDAKLQNWVDKGLIDDASAERIRVFEGEASRPLLLWALTGLGALAILLGAASLVAANWEDIPGALRLSVHIAAIAIMAALHLILRGRTDSWGGQWFCDARLWLIAGLGLAFFFHLEEVYDLDVPLWQVMLAWLIGFSPLLLGDGRTVSSAIGWAAGLMVFAVAFVASRADLLVDLNDLRLSEGILWAAILMLPSMAGLAGLRRDSGATRADFWAQIAAIGLYWQFLVANYFYLWGLSFWPEDGSGLAHLCLPLAAIVAQLTHRLNHMIQTPDMRLAQQPAMGVDRIAPAQLDLTVGDKFALSARFAIAQRLKLQQHDIGEAVIYLQEVHVLAFDTRHVEGTRGGIAQANLERIGP